MVNNSIDDNTIKDENKIKDEDKLYYHISKKHCWNGHRYDFDDIPPSAFTPIGGDLSVNWEKHCPTAQDCLNIATETYPNGRTAKTHGIGHFVTRDVRNIPFLEVIYSPSLMNKAHAHIQGIPPNKPKEPFNQMRKNLKRIFNSWNIRPELIDGE